MSSRTSPPRSTLLPSSSSRSPTAASDPPTSSPQNPSPTTPAPTPTPPPPPTNDPTTPNPPAPTNTSPPVVTSSIIAPTPEPTTEIITSTVKPPQQTSRNTQLPTTVLVTRTSTPNQSTTPSQFPTTPVIPTTSSNPLTPQKSNSGGDGLSTGGKTAIAVIIPIFVVALLIVGGIFLWRRRRRTKEDEEERRKEVEAYGYNPNHDPTLPVVGAPYETPSDDTSGYRGWGPSGGGSSVGRKLSNSASAGMTQMSDTNGYGPQPGSPTQGTVGTFNSDHHSTDPLMSGRGGHPDAELVGNLGHGPVAGAAGYGAGGLRRGPSNASSTYSMGEHGAGGGQADPGPPMPAYHPGQDYYVDNGYYQPAGPYDNAYGPGGGGGQQAIIRDNPARRNTRIQHAEFQPHQGGISQNF